jgi:anti-anti-sigma factor
MEVVCKDLQGIAVLQLMGSVGFGESDKLANEPEILCRSRDAIIDLEAVNYIDSAGLGRLVGLVQDYEKAGRRLVLAAPQDAVARIFKLTRLDQVIEIVATLDEAFGLLGKAS